MATDTLEWMDLPEGVSGVKGDHFFVHTGFNFAVYREGERKMTILVRRGIRAGGHIMSIPHDAFIYWEHSGVENSQEDQHRMRENFIAAMRFVGVTVE